jgi:hypothetical protein
MLTERDDVTIPPVYSMHVYSLYGTTISTEIPFLAPLPPSSAAPVLHVEEAYGGRPLDDAELLATMPDAYQNSVTIQRAVRLPDGEDVLLFPGGDQIALAERRITYRHAGINERRADYLDARLLGGGFAWWLLREGKLPLHAGAVVVNGEAILFLAGTGTGKSSLMCSLIAGGAALLCDDFVTIDVTPGGEIVAASAYPQMRLWPTTIERFIGSSDPYPTVFQGGTKRRVPIGTTWGQFLEGTFPVTRIYVLQREESTEGQVAVRRIRGHEAFVHVLASILMGSSFPTGDIQRIWPTLQNVAARVPLFSLSYPTGWHWLSSVRHAVARAP